MMMMMMMMGRKKRRLKEQEECLPNRKIRVMTKNASAATRILLACFSHFLDSVSVIVRNGHAVKLHQSPK